MSLVPVGIAARATDAYEAARVKVQRFLKAKSEKEIVFVRGTTEAINLVAQSHGRANVGKGDEILVTTLEHHANIVPWQMLCAETGAVLRPIPITELGEVDLAAYAQMLVARLRAASMLSFPRFFVFQPIGIMPPTSSHAEH